MSDSLDILGVKIAATNLQLTCQSIDRWVKERHKTYVCIAPVSTIVDCQYDPEYRKVVNSAGMATPDGMPLVWLARARGYKQVRRTYGPDLMLTLCNFGQTRGYRHYFYGATPEVLERLESRLKNQFPDVKIVGSFSPGFSKQCQDESPEVLQEINRLRPDILWAGLGSPKQDFWMYRHRDKLEVPVMIGVGAAFDFLAGTKPQAPAWMRGIGLEWFFRLCCEPKRLWKRYLIGNSRFIWYLLRDSLKKNCGRKDDS